MSLMVRMAWLKTDVERRGWDWALFEDALCLGVDSVTAGLVAQGRFAENKFNVVPVLDPPGLEIGREIRVTPRWTGEKFEVDFREPVARKTC